MTMNLKMILSSIISIVFLSVFIPNLIRYIPVFIAVSFLAFFVFIVQIRSGLLGNYVIRIIILFSLLGIVYIIASFMLGGWSAEYMYDDRFIVRQSYFVFMLPLFVVVGISIHNCFKEKYATVLGGYGYFLFFWICALDVLLAVFVSDEIRDGYVVYLDKGLVWLFVCTLYFYSVVYNTNKHKIFLVMNVFFIAENLFGYGVIFNAMTGVFLYFVMFTTYLYCSIKELKKFEFLHYNLVVTSIIIFVLIAPIFSDFFIDDLNTYWRLKSWSNNLIAINENYGLGAGFGVAYFPSTNEAVDAAFKSYLKDGSTYDLFDSLFVRGQHSSIVNVFFRMGWIGGFMLLLIILGVLKEATKHRGSRDVRFLTPIFVCGVLNTSVHVGLESPPFLITISVAMGLLLGAIMQSEDFSRFSIRINIY